MRISDWSSDVCSSDLVDGGARGVFRSLLGGGIAGLLVDFLLRYRIAAEHRLPARRRAFGKVGIGLGLGQIGARLCELLVDVRRLDFREQLAGFHVRADVDFPVFQIAAGARVDRRAGVSLEPARQLQRGAGTERSEEHTSELQSLMRNSYAVFCLQNKTPM